LFALYWLWSARDVKSAARTDGWGTMLAYRVPVAAGFALLYGFGHGLGLAWLDRRFVPATDWLPALGCVLLALGVAFACWARRTLGRNWSGVVQLKRDHELVTSGPYRHARHPIYTGMLLGVVGTALVLGEWRSLLALALMAAGFWFKLRHEERLMREQFGAAYVAYMQRVKALIPGVL
jgi:protein-S-isoprenylcysteine O-methyltransferase Ste14